MRVLHLSKTSHGARWASAQAGVLARRNVEVHVALPDLDGPVAREWMAHGARAHWLDYTFSIRRPWTAKASAQQLRRLVDVIQPDLVHAHHVAGSLLARLALRRYRSLLRIFQVPGPLHLENLLFRTMELSLATP